MSSTLKLIETFVREGNGVALMNLKAEVTTRADVRWTPELFKRKVDEIKRTAKLVKPSRSQVRLTPAQASKTPTWQATTTRWSEPKVVRVKVAGSVVSAPEVTLTLDAERQSTRADGKQFARALGQLETGTGFTYPVSLSLRQMERLGAGEPITLWLAERAHTLKRA